MVLTKIPFQIDMITNVKEEIMKVMVTIQFFELQNKMIATTDKTEIEIEAHVINSFNILKKKNTIKFTMFKRYEQ